MNMPQFNIDVTKQHSMPLASAKEKTEQIAQKMHAEYGITYEWLGDTINFRATTGAAKGVNGFLCVTSTTIQVHIELTFFLALGKAAIASKVEEYLKDAGAR